MDDQNWISFPKYSKPYIMGIKAFLQNAFPRFCVGEEMTCPCKNCKNNKWHCQNLIYDHLICNGPCPLYENWICEVSSGNHKTSNEHAENMDFEDNLNFGDNLDEMFKYSTSSSGPNDDAKLFYSHLEEGKQPLYPGCTKYSRLSFIIRLYSLKCVHGLSESGFGDLLELIKDAFPEAHIPLSFNAAKNVIKDLGLNYQKIHACPNNCMLFWAENENEQDCKTCGASRWVVVGKEADDNSKKLTRKVPANVMRYFPLKQRLKRMFMSKELSELMLWHAKGRKKDGKLRHPADAEAWKALDARYPQFAAENRNIRLGLASDGFNPFRTMKSTYSTCPIILVNYNLPPWLCMKQENLILSTLISGPESPGNNIDVFMQPLIAGLNELWDVGVETYDALTDHTFTLRASVLWTISDFPGLAMLFGWSTKGKLACPVCNYETSSMYLKHSRKMCYMDHRRFLDLEHPWRLDKKRFNGETEMRGCPQTLTGTDIEELLDGFVNQFGGKTAEKERKRKRQPKKVNSDSPFKKKSIFFNLPYWKHNLSRHNVDVMHIEKNVCDKIIGTLLNIDGKSKDHIQARLDLQELGIRKELHPVLSSDGKHLEIRAAIFDMTNEEKDLFCSVLKNAKLPYGSASNIDRFVHTKERKVLGYKSHDAHFVMHYLLQFAVKKSLKPEVAAPFIRLGAFLRGIWSKVIDLADLKRLQKEIIEIICQFETIFPNAFFDVMVHLLIHLCQEIEYGGPAHVRSMWPIERYLNKLKSYVRNRCKPEGSIAEGYLAEECLLFCSRFLGGDGSSKITKAANFETCPEKIEYPIGSRRNKDGKAIYLNEAEWMAIHRYILFNCGNKEIEKLIEEHRIVIDGQAKSKRYKQEREHSDDFWKWLKGEVGKRESISKELEVLAMGPNRSAKKYSGYVLNGFRFHTKYRDAKCTTQNSGVFVTAMTTSFASSKDQNPLIGDVNYHGAIEEIFEVDYWGEFSVVLFKCCWYKEEKDLYGLTRVNFSRLCHKSDPYVLASQVQQVFYVEDPTQKMTYNVIKKLPRDWCDVEAENANEEADVPVIHDIHSGVPSSQDEDMSWCRNDLPTRQVPINLGQNKETT